MGHIMLTSSRDRLCVYVVIDVCEVSHRRMRIHPQCSIRFISLPGRITSITSYSVLKLRMSSLLHQSSLSWGDSIHGEWRMRMLRQKKKKKKKSCCNKRHLLTFGSHAKRNPPRFVYHSALKGNNRRQTNVVSNDNERCSLLIER
jgi:hypothetical protein